MSVLDVIERRRSVRSYDSKPIDPELMAKLRDALRLAPSACNKQPWKFILVSDQAVQDKLAVAAQGQSFIAEAPVIVVGCGSPADAYKNMGGYWNSVEIDVAIALDHLTLAAAEAGLGTCWIGAFDEAEVKKLLGIPDDVKVVAMTPVGFPSSPDLIHAVDASGRKPEDKVFSTDRF